MLTLYFENLLHLREELNNIIYTFKKVRLDCCEAGTGVVNVFYLYFALDFYKSKTYKDRE